MLGSGRSRLTKVALGLSLGALSLVAYGCGSSSNNSSKTSSSCATKPSNCPANTTCWVADTTGKYACLPAKAGAGEGTACQNVVGQPTCDEGLGCFPSKPGSANGTCMRFCDNAGCSNTQQCYRVSLQSGGASVPMCGPLQGDAGSDSGPPPGDAGGQDSGSDAAAEASQQDAGSDAAQDTGSDAAKEASQSDSGGDAAQSDAASDAASD